MLYICLFLLLLFVVVVVHRLRRRLVVKSSMLFVFFCARPRSPLLAHRNDTRCASTVYTFEIRDTSTSRVEVPHLLRSMRNKLKEKQILFFAIWMNGVRWTIANNKIHSLRMDFFGMRNGKNGRNDRGREREREVVNIVYDRTTQSLSSPIHRHFVAL